jgi:hypothetical protein
MNGLAQQVEPVVGVRLYFLISKMPDLLAVLGAPRSLLLPIRNQQKRDSQGNPSPDREDLASASGSNWPAPSTGRRHRRVGSFSKEKPWSPLTSFTQRRKQRQLATALGLGDGGFAPE